MYENGNCLQFEKVFHFNNICWSSVGNTLEHEGFHIWEADRFSCRMIGVHSYTADCFLWLLSLSTTYVRAFKSGKCASSIQSYVLFHRDLECLYLPAFLPWWSIWFKSKGDRSQSMIFHRKSVNCEFSFRALIFFLPFAALIPSASTLLCFRCSYLKYIYKIGTFSFFFIQ